MNKSDHPTPACLGMTELFESTHVADHRVARQFCAKGAVNQCPALAFCQAELDDVLAAHGDQVQGTWAGRLLGTNRRVDAA